ncbi:substrate-binding periplasmic protein [Rheinheimera sp. 4Y26]|uniref:substrate-binding periplasmic protein n=1 Tax=Rheinheimera sp. 4Y26 TaxID=2977811 RepID=UPI0021B0EED2|nr:amino acid ABC transporter [Rheinheimera sp. 4Y26]MCT6699958.1 amino acid ABC transporter [Rheinheimera sp. 4Y26]
MRGILLLCCCMFVSSAQAAVPLRFCFEDKELAPYYYGNSAEVRQQNPGATIEHVQQLVAAVPALELKLIRLPWKRCLASLATGDVDAVVGSYSTERAEFAVFPYRDGQPDPTRAFNLHHTCLVSRQDAPWQWTGEGFSGIDQLVVARPLGYAPLKSKFPQKFTMHYTSSSDMDLDLLEKGRINAITRLCQIGDLKVSPAQISLRGLKILYPPLYDSRGYLIFSQKFYKQHQKLAELLWQQQIQNKGTEIYRRYLEE